MGLFGGGGGGDKYVDRSWDWAKDMSRLTEGGWQDIYNKSLGTASGQQSPWAQSSYQNAQGLLDPYLSGSQSAGTNPVYQQISSLYDPWAQEVNPYQTDLYKGAEELYQPTVDPLYAQLMDPLKRGIEGQYQNSMDQMLASGVRGGSLTDMLSGAASDRATSLNDMERGLRAQDIQRLDQTQQARAAALTNLASGIYGQQQTGRLARSSALSSALQALNSQDEQEQMTARMYLANLFNVLNQSDIERAKTMADVGIQGRYLTGNSLAQSGSAQDTSLMSGLLGMGSMLGMGMGQSGGQSGSSGMLSGLFGGSGSDAFQGNMFGLSDSASMVGGW